MQIMFNDRFGLTEAVLDGRKTMTRRIIKCPKKAFCFEIGRSTSGGCLLSFSNNKGNNVGEIWAKYKIGDVVALADKGTAVKITRCKKTKIDYKIEVLFNSHNFYPYRLEVTEI